MQTNERKLIMDLQTKVEMTHVLDVLHRSHLSRAKQADRLNRKGFSFTADSLEQYRKDVLEGMSGKQFADLREDIALSLEASASVVH